MGCYSSGSRRRRPTTLAVIAVVAAVAGCSALEKVGTGDHVYDEVRGMDLTARVPANVAPPNLGGPPPRSEIYRGTGIEGEIINQAAINGQQVAPVSNGNGFDLNFQNADVNAVAKALLGDV